MTIFVCNARSLGQGQSEDMSYSIYLVHLLAVHFAYRYTWQVFNHTGVRPLFIVGAAGIAVGASLIFYKLIERPFSLWTCLRLEEIFKVPAKIAIVQPSTDPEL